jgi:hypothetical protein
MEGRGCRRGWRGPELSRSMGAVQVRCACTFYTPFTVPACRWATFYPIPCAFDPPLSSGESRVRRRRVERSRTPRPSRDTRARTPSVRLCTSSIMLPACVGGLMCPGGGARAARPPAPGSTTHYLPYPLLTSRSYVSAPRPGRRGAARPRARAREIRMTTRDAARDKIRSRTYFYWPVMTYISALNLTGFWGRFVFPGRLRGSLLVPSSAVLPAVAPAAPGGGRFCA